MHCRLCNKSQTILCRQHGQLELKSVRQESKAYQIGVPGIAEGKWLKRSLNSLGEEGLLDIM